MRRFLGAMGKTSSSRRFSEGQKVAGGRWLYGWLLLHIMWVAFGGRALDTTLNRPHTSNIADQPNPHRHTTHHSRPYPPIGEHTCLRGNASMYSYATRDMQPLPLHHKGDSNSVPYLYLHNTREIRANQGVHPNPGPPKPWGPSHTHHILSSHNVTCLSTHLVTLCAEPNVDVHMLQEVSAPEKDHTNLKFQARLAPKQLHLGPLVPNTIFNLGGIGALSGKRKRPVEIPAKTPEFAKAIASGRVCHYIVIVDKNFSYHAYVCYLPTGAAATPARV